MVLLGRHRYSNITVKQKNKLSQIMNQANKITGYKHIHFKSYLIVLWKKTAIGIFKDHTTHPLHPTFEMLPLVRGLKIPLARRNAYKKSFVPKAAVILNRIIFWRKCKRVVGCTVFNGFNGVGCPNCVILHCVVNVWCEVLMCMYSGENKYLIHCLFFKFSHLQRMERSLIFNLSIVKIFQL